MLARRAAVAQVGGMDEAFFMFNEDVDWCRRMRQAGWTVDYEPAAVVMHHVGASRSRVAARVIWGRHLGMIHYFRKHHPTNPLLSLPADGAHPAARGAGDASRSRPRVSGRRADAVFARARAGRRRC